MSDSEQYSSDECQPKVLKKAKACANTKPAGKRKADSAELTSIRTKKASKTVESVKSAPATKTVATAKSAPATLQSLGGLFGLESKLKSAEKKKPAPTLQTYLTTRVTGGQVRRELQEQDGEYYVEFRVYNAQEATSAKPDQRWKKAEVTLKTRLDRDTPQWEALQVFMQKAYQMFQDSEAVFFKEHNLF